MQHAASETHGEIGADEVGIVSSVKTTSKLCGAWRNASSTNTLELTPRERLGDHLSKAKRVSRGGRTDDG
jgi:hypothetical protein